LDVALIAGIVAIGWAGMVAARTRPEVEAAPFDAAMGVAAVVVTLPLWWRRRYPLGALGASIAGIVIASAIDERGLYPLQLVVLGAVLCFAIGAWTERLRFAAAVLAVLVGLLVLGAAGDDANVLAAAAYGVAALVLPAVAGYATRTRRQYLEEVERRLAEAERDRDERARQAVRDERTRIARELHDVVAHHVSLIGVQAGAARTALDTSPEASRAALQAIDESSRAAVGEMRQLLDALAPLPGDESAAADVAHLVPQPSLRDLETLAARWRDAGVPVDLHVTGDVDALAPALSLCCFRIVEEAVTNVARHAAVRSAAVRVDASPSTVTIEVTNPPPSAGAGPAIDRTVSDGRGRGLVGMRERVALFDGRLEVGVTADGGFSVHVRLPRDAS
jgi:signal transduction histidine kinase